jgi:hypothetical protein
MEELISIITSTEMPDHDYPVFRLLETEEMILAEFSWHDINIGAAGINEEDVVFEAALLFTIAVEDWLDKAFRPTG